MAGTDVIVVGGGVVGVSTAYSLACAGARVTIVEGGELGRGASYGNAGLIVPSYSVPIATPEALSQGLRWLFDPGSPFTIKPRLDPDLLAWVVRFVAACRKEKVVATTAVLRTLGVASINLYEQFSGLRGNEVGYQRTGWLYLYKTERGLAEGIHHAERVRRVGTQAVNLDQAEVKELEPAARADLAGAVHYVDDAHLNPFQFVHFLASLAGDQGVTFRTHVQAVGLKAQTGTVQAVRTGEGELEADSIVIAAGAWSPRLARSIGLRLPVQPAKGYSLTFRASGLTPRRPLSLGEAHVAVTPMGQHLRMTGGLELAGFDHSLNARRLAAISRAGSEYLVGLTGMESSERWSGYRPLTPDSLPIIGPGERFKNLFFATGHGTLGVTLGPITGKLVAELVAGEQPSIDVQPLLPCRFGL
ncbi:MAG TPA: FAD-dependent oxidoreductase [Chloroflexi bacterium]|nr:FAD-dependent oxidoreductase [Chloroflexota bacterium]